MYLLEPYKLSVETTKQYQMCRAAPRPRQITPKDSLKKRRVKTAYKIKSGIIQKPSDFEMSSAGSESSDEPSPVCLSPVKRFEDFSDDETRAKYFSARNGKLDIVRKNMMIIRGKRRRKAEREQRKKMKVDASEDQSPAPVFSISNKHHEATSIPVRPGIRRHQNNDEQGSSPRERLFDVSKRLSFDDEIIPIVNLSKTRAAKTQKEDSVIKYYDPDSRYRPKYEPCKPLTMKGRSKEIRHANKAVSFGLVKLGGDNAHVTVLRGLPNIRRGKITMANYIRDQRMRKNDEHRHTVGESPDTFDSRPNTRRRQSDKDMEESVDINYNGDSQDDSDIEEKPRKQRRLH